MEAQDIPVLDGMGDSVGVELLLEEVLCGAHGGLRVHDLLLGGIGLEDGRAGEAKELGQRKEFLNRLVVLTELRSMALIEDEDDALVLECFELLLEGGLAVLAPLLVALAVFIQREAELLDGGDDDLVRIVFGEQAANEGSGVRVFLHATFLKLVELLACLTVEVFAINYKDAFVDVVVFLEQCRCLEGSERLATAGGVPYETVAIVLLDALDHVLNGIHLVGPHDHELLLAGEQHHVAADGSSQVAFFQETIGEGIKMRNLSIILARKLVDRQKALVCIEGEVAGVVVRKVVGAVAIADDKELHEAEQRLGVAIAGIVFVVDDLFHSPTGIHAEGLQLDLDNRHTIYEKNDIVAVVAIAGIDAKLVDDLEVVLAPILNVHQRVIQRSAIIAGECVDAAQDLRASEGIWRDYFIQQARELGVCEANLI